MFQRLINIFKKAKPCLALDIGSSTIKFLQLSQHVNHYCVENFAIIPHVPSTTSQVLHGIVQQFRELCANVSIALPTSAVISKIIQLPAYLSTVAIEQHILLDAERYLPYPLTDIHFDFHVLGPNARDHQDVDVLLVITRTESLQRQLAPLQAVGMNLQVVDVQSYSLARVVNLLTTDSGVTALMELGAEQLALTIFSDNQVIFSQSEMLGGQQLTQAIQQHYQLTTEVAEHAKIHNKLPVTYQTEILMPFQQRIVWHVQRMLQIFQANFPQEKLQQIFLAGGSAGLSGLAAVLAEQLKVNVKLADPFVKMKLADHLTKTELVKAANSLVLCAGLALR